MLRRAQKCLDWYVFFINLTYTSVCQSDITLLEFIDREKGLLKIKHELYNNNRNIEQPLKQITMEMADPHTADNG